VACMGEDRKVYTVWAGNPEGRDHLEERGIDWKTESECILGR
jgi:hypothetical protein